MLTIELSKQPDGAVILRCIRADGSITWQKQTSHAAHFVAHDLTHYAVETTLGCCRAFFGLIADGWEISDTTGKGTRGALPPEATEIESIVGLFDSERGSGTLWTEQEFNSFSPRPLTQLEIQNIRQVRGKLFESWSMRSPHEKLELHFPASE